MWAQLREKFSDPELVEMGYFIGICAGGQRWIHALEMSHGDDAGAPSTVGYRPDVAQDAQARGGFGGLRR